MVNRFAAEAASAHAAVADCSRCIAVSGEEPVMVNVEHPGQLGCEASTHCSRSSQAVRSWSNSRRSLRAVPAPAWMADFRLAKSEV